MNTFSSTNKLYGIQTHIEINFPLRTSLQAVTKLISYVLVIILESLFGLHLGAIAGWCGGWCLGKLYQAIYEPAHLITIDSVKFWYYLSIKSGQYAAILGAALGVIFAIIIFTFIAF